MIPARFAVAATIVGASFIAVPVLAQTAQPAAPPMKSVLAGKKFTPPVRGEATIDIIKQPTRREGQTLVTKIQVKNTSTGPIARLKVVETWFDKDGNMIPGGESAINGLLQPGEIGTLEIRTPVNQKMLQSRLQFSHPNGGPSGGVKPSTVKSFEGATDAATKNASATKPAPKTAAVKTPAAKTAAAKKK